MSNQAEGKPKYETPTIVPLGEMAKGSGACTAGSSVIPDPATCAPFGGVTCSAGTSPVDYCSAGTCATALGASYCSAGFTASATAYCSAGNSGGACSNGGSA